MALPQGPNAEQVIRAVTWEAQGFSLVSMVVLLDELANFVNKF